MFIHRKFDALEAVPQKAGKGVAMKMLLSPEESPNFAMRNFTIQAGGHMPLHTNIIEHEQYVLGGRAKVTIGEDVFEASVGDILLIPESQKYKKDKRIMVNVGYFIDYFAREKLIITPVIIKE